MRSYRIQSKSRTFINHIYNDERVNVCTNIYTSTSNFFYMNLILTDIPTLIVTYNDLARLLSWFTQATLINSDFYRRSLTILIESSFLNLYLTTLFLEYFHIQTSNEISLLERTIFYFLTALGNVLKTDRAFHTYSFGNVHPLDSIP